MKTKNNIKKNNSKLVHKKVPLDTVSRGTLNKTAATYSPTSTQYHRRDGA